MRHRTHSKKPSILFLASVIFSGFYSHPFLVLSWKHDHWTKFLSYFSKLAFADSIYAALESDPKSYWTVVNRTLLLCEPWKLWASLSLTVPYSLREARASSFCVLLGKRRNLGLSAADGGLLSDFCDLSQSSVFFIRVSQGLRLELKTIISEEFPFLPEVKTIYWVISDITEFILKLSFTLCI